MPLYHFLPPLGAVLIWSGNMTINQLTVGAIAPSSIAFLRWALALAVPTPFLLPATWRHRATLRREWPKLAVLGLLGMGLWQGLAYAAAATTTATDMGRPDRHGLAGRAAGPLPPGRRRPDPGRRGHGPALTRPLTRRLARSTRLDGESR